MAVVLAMGASYLLSRTLIPTMIRFLLPAELHLYKDPEGETEVENANWLWRVHRGFHHGFEKLRDSYSSFLASALERRGLVVACFVILSAACVALYPYIGTDFFPRVDAGQIRLHVRAASGSRIEETEQKFAQVERTLREIIPASELSDILDNIGLPASGNNLAMGDNVTLGTFDGEILISLSPGHHSTWDYVRELRRRLPQQHPDLTFFFQPADIVGQILNFGLPAPIDVQVAGPLHNLDKNFEFASEIARRIGAIPGATDVHVHQVRDVPMMRVDVDRDRASQMGFTQKDVAHGMLISLSSSFQVGANYWINPANGVDYNVAVQTPTYRVDSAQALMNTPISGGTGQTTELLSNVASVTRGLTSAVVSHYNVQPVFDVYSNVQDRDLGGVAGGCRQSDRRIQRQASSRQLHRHARPGGDHALFVPGDGLRPCFRHHSGLLRHGD